MAPIFELKVEPHNFLVFYFSYILFIYYSIVLLTLTGQSNVVDFVFLFLFILYFILCILIEIFCSFCERMYLFKIFFFLFYSNVAI